MAKLRKGITTSSIRQKAPHSILVMTLITLTTVKTKNGSLRGGRGCEQRGDEGIPNLFWGNHLPLNRLMAKLRKGITTSFIRQKAPHSILVMTLITFATVKT